MTEQEKRLHRCCFAGHRPESILLSEATARDWLRYQIQQAIAANYTTFITGMGMGFDIWAAQTRGLETTLYPFPRMNTGASPRPYPLNLIDAIMESPTCLSSRPVELSDLPPDFDRRLAVALSTLPGNHDPGEILLPRYRDGATLMEIASAIGVTRERIRQLIEQSIRRLRHPELMRYLNCGIENIPPKTSKAMIKRLEDAERIASM